MNSKKIAAFAFGIIIIGAALLFSLGGVQPQGEKLVIYNGFAYYEQNAKVTGPEVSFMLPDSAERDSVTLRLASGYVTTQHIKEANYTAESDLLKSYVGKEVSIYDENGKEIKGTLAKYDYGRAYVKTPEGLYIITPSYYLLPGFDGNMSEENMSVVFKITPSAQTDAKLSYLMDGISWAPDYALYLNGNGGSLSLYGAVSNPAKDYDNVSLSLFYGEVRRMGGGYYYSNYDYMSGSAKGSYESGSAPSYTPSAIGEYYKFDLGNVALPQGDTKFNLMEKSVSQIRKTYEMEITGYSYEESQPLAVILTMNNSNANGLGVALPAGKVRVIDAGGFVGEDYASETPKGEELRLQTGNAFDIIGTSKLVNQTSEELINCDPRIMAPQNAPLCVNEKGYIYVNIYEYEATVKNKKSESANIVLTYSPYGEWVIMDETLPSEKVSQNQVKWRFALGPDSEKTLKFTIKVKTGNPGPYYNYAEGSTGGVARPA